MGILACCLFNDIASLTTYNNSTLLVVISIMFKFFKCFHNTFCLPKIIVLPNNEGKLRMNVFFSLKIKLEAYL